MRAAITAQVCALEDDALIDTCWAELAVWEAMPVNKQAVEEDIEDAIRQLTQRVVLSREGRSRLRRFLITKWVTDHERERGKRRRKR